MGAKTYKRVTINLTEELDHYVLELRKRKEYVRCSYLEIIRVLMEEGAKSLGVHRPCNDGKSWIFNLGDENLTYYPTLCAEIARQGITKKELAASIGICYRALNNKLSGRVAFTWPEVETIKNKFFPDMPPEVLFAHIDPEQFSAEGGA